VSSARTLFAPANQRSAELFSSALATGIGLRFFMMGGCRLLAGSQFLDLPARFEWHGAAQGAGPTRQMAAVRIPHSPPRPWTPTSADATPTSTAKEPEPEPEQRVPAAKAADGEVKVIQLDPTSRLYGSKLPSAAAMSRQANESASKRPHERAQSWSCRQAIDAFTRIAHRCTVS